MNACNHLGNIVNWGLDILPDIFECRHQSRSDEWCMIHKDPQAVFGDRTIPTCEGCPLYCQSQFNLPAQSARNRPLPVLEHIGQKPKKSGPSIFERGFNFARAIANWAAGGFKTRTEEQINERLAICRACPELVNDHCQKCGCACAEANRLINKLALATEKCPLGNPNRRPSQPRST